MNVDLVNKMKEEKMKAKQQAHALKQEEALLPPIREFSRQAPNNLKSMKQMTNNTSALSFLTKTK